MLVVNATEAQTAPLTDRPLEQKFTLRRVYEAVTQNRPMPMLTCYDATTAGVLQKAGVPLLLVGDTAAVTILGYPSTTAAPLELQIALTAAVVRGGPNCFVMADMTFGSYHASEAQGIDNVCRMVRETGCDAVKLELVPSQADLVAKLTEAGVAVVAHLGLRPQAVQTMGYRTQGTSAEAARRIVQTARQMRDAGAAMILLEAVPGEVSETIVKAVDIPVIGCGAGPACHGHVVVLQDLLGHTGRRPKLVPDYGEPSLAAAARRCRDETENKTYPAPEHGYAMAEGEREQFLSAHTSRD